MKKAFFLDRDGVINVEVDYLSRPEDVRLIPGAAEAIRFIREAGFLVIAISNQSGIARGYFTMEDLHKVEEKISAELAKENAGVDAWYYCPHHKKGIVPEYTVDCDCRKPKPGLILQAAKDFEIDLGNSVMIGDKLSDVQCGVNAGVGYYAKVSTGHGSEEAEAGTVPGMISAESLLPAVKEILKKINTQKEI